MLMPPTCKMSSCQAEHHYIIIIMTYSTPSLLLTLPGVQFDMHFLCDVHWASLTVGLRMCVALT